MGTTLTGKVISATYDALLKVTDNDAITSSAKQITDGLGNNTPLYISSTRVGIGVTPTTTFHVSGNSQIGGNLTVTGDLLVEGSTTTIDTSTLSVEDPLIIVGSNNTTSDAVDLGIYGVYDTSGSQNLYAGIFRRAADNKFHIFRDLQIEPTTTVNTSGTGYTVATLVGNVEGTLTGVIASTTTATTQSTGDNSTKVATTAYVDTTAGNYLPLAGGTMSGNIAMGSNNISGGGTFTATTFSGQLDGTISSATTAVTQSDGDNSTKVATTAYVDTAIQGHDTLAEVLVGGNTTGGTDIAVSSGDNITFADSSKTIYGAGSDLSIYSDGTDGYVIANIDDLVLRSADDIFMEVNSGANAIKAVGGAAVELYYNNSKKFETTNTGINVTGGITGDDSVFIEGNTNPNFTAHDITNETYTSLWSGDTEAALTFNHSLFRITSSAYNFTGTDLVTITSGGNTTFAGKISSVKELINVNSANGTRSGGFEVQDDGDLFIGTATTAGNIVLETGNTTNGLPSTGTARLTVNSTGATFANNVTVQGAFTSQGIDDNADATAITINGNEEVGIGTTTPFYKLDVNGTFRTTGNATFAGDVIVPEYIKHSGDEDTSIRFTTNNIKFYTANNEVLELEDDGQVNIISAGTVTNPCLTIGDDVNTGIWRPASDTFAISTGGNERMRIDSGGDVGIGVNSPSTKLEVLSSQSNSSIRTGGLEMQSYAVNNSWYAENLYYDGAWKLRSNGHATQMYMEAGVISFKRVASGSAGDSVSPLTTMVLNSDGNVGIGTTSPRNDANFVTLQVGSTATAASQIVLDDNDSNGPWRIISNQSLIINDDATERMRIDSSGNVCINNTSVTGYNENFNVTGQGIVTENTNGGNRGIFGFFGGTPLLIGTGDGVDVVFRTDNTERMRINSSGNVGIGTTNPQNKFVVANGTDNTQNIEIAPNYIQSFNRQSGNLGYASMGFYASSYTFNTGKVSVGVCSGTLKEFNIKNQGSNGGLRIEHSGSSNTVAYIGQGGSGDEGVIFLQDSGVDTVKIAGENGVNSFINSGNVGIGTTSPVYKLDVDSTAAGDWITRIKNQSSTGYGLYVQSSNNAAQYMLGLHNGDGYQFIVNGAGNVGIGTTSPSNQFVIKEGSNVDMEFGSEGSGCFIQTYNRTTSAWGYLRFIAGGGEQMRIHTNGYVGIGDTSPAKPLVVYNAAPPGGITIKAQSGNASNWIQNVSTGSSWQMGSTSTGWQLYNDDTSEYRVTVTNAGNVGIGTTSPQKALHIEGASGASASQLLVCGPSDTIGDTAGILLRAEGGEADSALRAKGGIFFEREAANGLGKLHLCNNNSNNNDSATLADAALTITQGTNVGIGTTSPNQQLDVSGNIAVRGGYKIYFNSEVNLNRYIGASSSNDLDIAADDDINYRSNFNRFFNGSTEFARLSGSGVSWLGGGSNGYVGIGTTSPTVPLAVHGQQKWYTTNNDGNELRGFFNPGGSADDGEFSVYKADGATEGVVLRGAGNTYIRIDSTSLKFINFYYGTSNVGQIVTGGTNVLYQSNSDYRLKENVVEMTGALDRVSQLKPSRYNFISQPETQVDGFMAHELQEVVPQAVSGEKDEMNEDGTPKYQGVDHSQIVPLLVGAIKELKAEIETLKTQINK